RFSIEHGSFSNLDIILKKQQIFGKVNGILFDLGVSSPQLDNPDRGFSFLLNGKLDMRMDWTQGDSAAVLLTKIAEKELSRILWEYGEERYARRIAHAIIEARNTAPIIT